MSLRAASLLAACLVGSAGASSLTVAMTDIRGRGEFDPKEPPDHKTDIKVGVYLEHLLDVSTPPAAPHRRAHRRTHAHP